MVLCTFEVLVAITGAALSMELTLVGTYTSATAPATFITPTKHTVGVFVAKRLKAVYVINLKNSFPMKFKIYLTCVFLIMVSIAKGQTANNLRFEQSGKMVDVYYDLSGKVDESFQVRLFCSQDGGRSWGTPLNFVTGDVGENIKIGTNKKITWNVLKEQEKLIGDILFKIEVNVSVLKEGEITIIKEEENLSMCRNFSVTHIAEMLRRLQKQ